MNIRKLYFSIKMHWRLYLIIIILLLLSYKLFFGFYSLRLPYVLKTEAGAFIEASQDRALCNQELELMKQARNEANKDVMKESWNN